MNKKILIIDDERAICTAILLALRPEFDVKAAVTAPEGLTLLAQESFQLVLLDLRIGAIDGLEVLREIKRLYPQVAVIMMTAYGSIRSSVDAMKSGAFTYLTKPLDIEELEIFIRQALEFQQLNEKIAFLSDELASRYQYGEMIGKSPLMQQVYSLIDKLKDIDAAVLISGESGTGKELAARAIHYLGKRKNEKFVVVNCAAIPEGLLEEEFFGHKRGAFTGAYADKQGKFADADHGTIFLDEIGDMPLSLQGKLLRVLQQKEFTPIGSNDIQKTNVRIIAATNRSLADMVAAGTFRQDLYYRLNVIEIRLPPLRDRRQDIPMLYQQFIDQFNREQGKSIKGLTNRAERFLLDYSYPGNVRELANIIEYAGIVCNGDVIDITDLKPTAVQLKTEPAILPAPAANALNAMSLRDIEKIAIRQSLERHNWKKQDTARELGISERGLWNKIKEYHLEP